MKIAIPTDGYNVSTRFFDAPKFMLAEIMGDQIVDRTEIDINELGINQRIKILVDEQVTKLICCGIDNDSDAKLKRHGVTVCPSIKGEVEKVLDRFINHNIYCFFG